MQGRCVRRWEQGRRETGAAWPGGLCFLSGAPTSPLSRSCSPGVSSRPLLCQQGKAKALTQLGVCLPKV